MSAETDFVGLVGETHNDARVKWNKMLHKVAEWVVDYTYGLDEITAHQGVLYKSTSASNLGNEPGVDSGWDVVSGGGGGGVVNSVFGVSKATIVLPDLRTETTAENADEILLYDVSSGTPHARMTRANFLAGVVPTTRQVLPGLGLIGGGPLSSDVTLHLNFPNLGFLASLQTTDVLAVYDVSTFLHREITVQQLLDMVPAAPVTSVFSRTGIVVAASGDYNAGQVTFSPVGNLSSVTTQDAIAELESEKIQKELNTLSSVTVASADLVAVWDTSAGLLGSATVQSILDLASGAVTSVFGRTGAVVAATSDYDASQVDFTPAGSISATDVQAAIAELDSEKLVKDFSTLGLLATIDGADLLAVHDVSGSTTGKTTITNLLALAEGSVTSVFGRTGSVTAQTSDYDAVQVDFTPAGGLAATTVQAALEELDTEKVPTSRSVIAGSGLSGGGTLASDRTFNLDIASEVQVATLASGDYVAIADVSASNVIRRATVQQILDLVPADAVSSVFGRSGDVVAVSGDYDASEISFTASGSIVATDVEAAIQELDTEKVPTTRTISTGAGAGISGGGDLSANRTLSIDIQGMAALTTPAGNDEIAIYDVSATAHRKITRDNLFSFAGFSSETNVPTSAQILISDAGTLKVAQKSAVLPKQSWGQSAAPDGSVNDETQGYETGSLWGYAMDASGFDHCYVCIDATDGAAKWRQITVPRFRQNANSAPSVNDDVDMRYVNSSMWHWDEKGRTWVCLDNTNGAAVWSEFGGPATRVKATLSSDVTLTSGMANVVFNTESDDEFNEFNTTTGFYVAGADGQYVVEVSLHSSDSGLAAAELWTGTGLGAKTRVLQVHNNSDAHETFTLDLTAGDQVWVKAQWVGASNKTLQADSTRTFVTYRRSR